MAPPRNRRPGFSRRAQYSLFLGYVIAVAGSLVGAGLLVVSAINPPAFSALRAGAGELTAPIGWGLGAVIGGVAALPSDIGGYFGVHNENVRLKQELAAERASLLRARALAFENRRLKLLLSLREPGSDPVATARLVGSSASSTRRYATLYAGLLQGLCAGQSVRGPSGLIGRVLEAGPNTARVLMLVDPESIVPVRRTRDGAAGFAAGRGDTLLDVKPIALANAEFQPGDVLVTSGVGGIYPPNIPVALVVSRSRDGALARPVEHPDAMDFATVLPAYLPPLPPPAEPGR
ncbi:rod shape-determining protein MreC [uncultured Sphingomonas sp.]|uniref:rod shape-determining protein MreC n=1 Tax=uncultured Sphingomonas sp. TaxID=158754 RepID=UPI0035C9CB9C